MTILIFCCSSIVMEFIYIFFWFTRPKLKEHMQYCMSHPEEMNKLSKLKAQITEVKGIMMDNIEKVHLQFVVLLQ